MKTTSIFLALTAVVAVIATEPYHPHEPYKPNKCHADKCLRGVRGTAYGLKPPLETRLADCKDYQVTVIKKYKPDVTKTSTTTITLPPKPYRPKPPKYEPPKYEPPKYEPPKYEPPKYEPPKKHHDREAEPEAEAEPEPEAEAHSPPRYWPKHVPAYATYCPSPERYASACECVGYHKETKTIYKPGKTVKVVVTKTVKAKKPKPTKYEPPKHHPKPPKHHPKPPKYDSKNHY